MVRGRVAAIVAVAALLLSGCTTTAELTSYEFGEDAAPAPVVPAPAPSPEPASTPTPERSRARTVPAAPQSSVFVTGIVDGDTIDTTVGRIRVLGIDTPERGECGYDAATAHAGQVVPIGSPVTLSSAGGKDEADRYGRLLRYIAGPDGRDLGLAQISSGHAIARYDSRDGYGWHPKERQYIEADAAVGPIGCPDAPALGLPPSAPIPGNPGLPDGPGPGPDVDCRDLAGPVWVGDQDWHWLDGDGDGIGCE